MNERELRDALAVAKGEAMFASLLLAALLAELTRCGIVPKKRVIDITDGVLLVLEENRAKMSEDDAAIDHARSRLQALIAGYSKILR